MPNPGYTLALFLLGLDVIIGIACYTILGTLNPSVLILLGFPGILLLLLVMISWAGHVNRANLEKQEKRLAELDPQWAEKLKVLHARLNAATYRWQWREFGDATRAFWVEVSWRGYALAFGNFHAALSFDDPALDRDFADENERFEATDAREKEIARVISPGPERIERLHEALEDVVARTLSSELRNALAKEDRIHISTMYNENFEF